MSQATINLIEEWAKRRHQEIRAAKLWTGLAVVSLLSMGIGASWMGWQIPSAYRERALWQARAERLQSEPAELSAPPIPPETVRHARMRTVEFQIILLAVTRFLPRNARLHEMHVAFQPEKGLVLTLRGTTLGFEPVKLFTERLRAVQLFSEITPISVSRQEGEGQARWSRFEMRLTMPTSDPAPAQGNSEGGSPE
ncbi:MAG: hypothetical protein C4336_08635 [Armatimonadota bacterium]